MPANSFSRRSPLARFNEAFTSVLLALWPEEKKSWGCAFAAESAAIDSPQKQFRWLLGGLPVVLREIFTKFLGSLGRPIGVGPADIAGDGSQQGRSPRTPRVVLALLFLIFIALLAQPQTRTVFRSVSQAYSEAGWDSSRWQDVRRLQILAEENLQQKNPDPQLLAFASLLYSDEQKRLAFADAAIHADPSLAWIDFQNAILPGDDTTKQHTLSAKRIDRMLAADPGNGILHLLRAESISIAYQRKDAQADPSANRIASWGKGALRDAGWLAAMDATFKAPYYDTYDAKLFQLSREVVQRYSVSDPRIPASVLGRRPLDQYQAIRTYADVLLSRAVEAQRSGDIQSAIADCTLILDFAQHVRAANLYKLEAWMANDIESQAYPVLQSVYEGSGRRREAIGIAARIQENRAQRAAFSSTLPHFSRRVSRPWSKAERAALFMQGSVLAIWILLPVSLASVILLWFFGRRLRVTASVLHSRLCVFSDWCPVLLVAACAVLFLVYAPYDHAYREILGSPLSPASYQDFGNAAYALFALPPIVRAAMGSLCGPHGRFLACSALTAVLVLLCVTLVMRQFKRPHFRRNG